MKEVELFEIERSLWKRRLASQSRDQPLGNYPDFEVRLLSELSHMLLHPTCVDVGAHRGDVTQAFCEAGLKVYSIEASPAQVQYLRGRFSNSDNVQVLHAAISNNDEIACLHLADLIQPDGYGSDAYNSVIGEDVPSFVEFPSSISVPGRTLASLVMSGLITSNIGILKIDTEGHDLAVLAGAWPFIGEITIVEYWSKDFIMSRDSTRNDISDYRAFLSDKPEHLDMLVFVRDENCSDIRFQINPRASLPNSWGNVLLFRRKDMMKASITWCVETLSKDRYAF